MTKFSALLATASLLVFSLTATAQESAEPASITQFLSDSAPAECTIQVTSLPRIDAEQSATDILSAVPITPCDAVSGTDDSNSKNFNFIDLTGNNIYKVITASAPIAETESQTERETHEFSVAGVKVVPLDEDGGETSIREIEYLYPHAEQVCITDAIEQPRSVVCTFEVQEAGNVLVGQLSYAW